MRQNRKRLSRKRRTGKKTRSPDRLMTLFRQSELNRNNKHWGRSNHGDHGASRGMAITIVIPVFPCPPWLNLCTTHRRNHIDSKIRRQYFRNYNRAVGLLIIFQNPDPFSVWTNSVFDLPSRLKRICARRAWKASQFEQEEISR